MKYYLVALFALLFSCKKTGYSDSDFSGKTFTARIKLDSTVKDPLAVGLLAATTMSFEFRQGGIGLYKAGFGAVADERSFDWVVKPDSLLIQMKGGQKSRLQRYLIKDSQDGMLISEGPMTLELTKK